MTAQAPERLENLHPTCAFEGLALYDVVRVALLGRGPGSAGYAFERQPRPPAWPAGPDGAAATRTCTGLRRGYVATLRLEADGRLALVRYEYPLSPPGPGQVEEVGEALRGDFWLELRPTFLGSATYVPFVDGRVVTDRSRWRGQAGAWSQRLDLLLRASAVALGLLALLAVARAAWDGLLAGLFT